MNKNSLDLVMPFVQALGPEHDLQIVGGVGSFVLGTENVEIKPEERLVIASADTDFDQLGQFRDDGNRRDLDILVMSSMPRRIEEVEAIANETVGKELVLSVFGLHQFNQLHQQQQHPWLSLAKVWLADRYVIEAPTSIRYAKKALFPFEVDMELETMDNWQLIVGKDDENPIPIPHPGTVILNYLTRSISGLRPKDADKVEKLSRNVFAKSPELAEWIVDGPGKSQVELARIFHSLRGASASQPITIGQQVEIKPFTDTEITEHEAMIYRADPGRAASMLRVCKTKAQALHFLESQQAIVTPYQRFLEQRLGLITGNR